MTKEYIYNYLYEEANPKLEELLKISQHMKEYDFEEEDYEELNDAIDDIIDCCDTMDELLPIVDLIKKYNYDMTSVYKKINILNVLKNKKIKKMNQEELEYILYDQDLTYDQLLELKDCMKKYDFLPDDYKYVDDLIKENKPKETKSNNVKFSFFELLFLALLFGNNKTKHNPNNKPKSTKYAGVINFLDEVEDYQLEEEELEDDDYYFEDID